MGLDMTLLSADRITIDNDAIIQNAECIVGKNVVEELYWRKFNGLHSWFVNTVQNGVDDCNTYHVTREDLALLHSDLVAACESRDPGPLAPVSGFFFGSTEVDSYYWRRMDEACTAIGNLLSNFDWENRELFYEASW